MSEAATKLHAFIPPRKPVGTKPLYRLASVFLHVEKKATLETFQQIAKDLAVEVKKSKRVQFLVGDYVLQVEARFGLPNSLMIFGYDQATLNNIRWVCSKVPPDIRREALSFSHHKLVAHLKSQVDIEAALTKAEDEGWTVQELKKHLKSESGENAKATSVRVSGIRLELTKGEIILSVRHKDTERVLHRGNVVDLSKIEFSAQEISEAFE